MSSLLTHMVIRTFVSAQILVLLLGGAAIIIAAKPPVPVLTLDAGDGIVAEFSDYGLTDYEFVNGQYRGNFCFTLKNTSQRSSPALPIYLVAMGFIADTPAVRFELSPTYVPPGNFVVRVSPLINEDTLLDAFLVADNFFSKELIDGPTDGVGVGESLSVCMPLRSSQPFTFEDLLNRFTVMFSDSVEACYQLERFPNVSSYSRIAVTSLGDNEFGFQIMNRGGVTAPGEVITGVGFDVPNRSEFSLLSINPSPQPGSQNFWFSNARKTLKLDHPDRRRKLEFGLLTGSTITEGITQFGLAGVTTSSVFRIGGDFTGLTTRDILTSALVRIPSGWETNGTGCIQTDPTGGGIRATVATNPR